MNCLKIKLFIFFIFFAVLISAYPTDVKFTDSVSVIDFGAKGDGLSNDWEPIQRAIDYIAKKEGGIVYFPKGNYNIIDNTIIVWGKNIKIKGEEKNKTIITKKGKAGWWGDAITVAGKIPNEKYYGGFGTISYKTFVMYSGLLKQACNIRLESLTVTTENDKISKYVNNLGIINSKDVIIKDCIFLNAVQTNIAVVNDTEKFTNNNVIIENCILSGAGSHNLRVISYNSGRFYGNSVQVFNSLFKSIKAVSTLKEISGKRPHVWYRGNKNSTYISLSISNSFFDESGNIIATMNSGGLKIFNSTINGFLDLRGTPIEDVVIKNNNFKNSFNKSFLVDKRTDQFMQNKFNFKLK